MRRVQVVDVDLVLGGVVAVLVGRAVPEAALDAAAGQPHREAVRVVVAAVVAALGRRRPAELAAPQHQRVLQQARAASGPSSRPAIGWSTSRAFFAWSCFRSPCWSH